MQYEPRNPPSLKICFMTEPPLKQKTNWNTVKTHTNKIKCGLFMISILWNFAVKGW